VIDESNHVTDRAWIDAGDALHAPAGDQPPEAPPSETDAAQGAAVPEPTPSASQGNENGSREDRSLASETATQSSEPAPETAEAGASEEPRGQHKEWYILKVQSNREDSIRDGLLRRVKIHGLDDYFGEVIVPTELVTEFKNGKKKITKRKLYPGYLMVNMEINEETWFLVRETPGIGDFTGSAGKPSAMLPHEVAKILAKQEEKTDESPKLKIAFNVGDRVKINEGTFANFEGDVENIDEANGRVTVMINIFGRSTPVELEYWQVEGID
jgi:transcriptional antiterminator NusG